MPMPSFYLPIASLLSLSLMTGCATGLRAEASAAPFFLPDAAETVRVRILHTKVPARLACTGTFQFQLKKGGKIYTSDKSVRVRAVRNTIVFDHKSFKGDVAVIPAGPSEILKLNGRRYRGAFLVHPGGSGRYDVIEYVGLQEYLYGVLPREVEASWPLDALKAQAVVSRTYALANKAQDAKGHFDLSDGVFDQVYGGMEVEDPSSNRAVDETSGEVLLDSNGKPIQAFFHSSCGGRTELPDHVWKSSFPEEGFGCVSDSFCQEDPHYKWKIDLSYATIRQRLRKAGIRLADIKKVSIVQKSNSGRAQIIGLQTSKGTVEVSGNRFRLAMGADSLRSTLFINMKPSAKGVNIEGRGWGHGVGLCQWGARGRAAAGQTYDTILQAYYPKAILKKISLSPK